MKQIIFSVDPEIYKKEIVSEVVDQLTNSKNRQEPLSVLLTRKETANYLRIALSTLWKLTKSGQIRAVYLGNRVFYKEEDVKMALHSLYAK